jgi:Icc protein
MEGLTRRSFLSGSLAVAATPLLSKLSLATPAKKLRFVFATDFHIEPELSAPQGVSLAVKKILSLRPRPEFIVVGGDTVMDALGVTRERADLQFKLFTEAVKPLEMPIHYVVGNHDVYGWMLKGQEIMQEPVYGKKLYQDLVVHGPTYRSWDQAGMHFVILDSIQPGKAGGWFGRIDDDQLTWLKNDLEKTTGPTIAFVHVPLMTIFNQYAVATTSPLTSGLVVENGKQVFDILSKHSVKAVFQGHTHVVEECDYLGTKYITGGAICGDWWKGPRLGVHPEGFMVVDCDGGNVKTEYVPYGWKAVRA